MYDDFVWTPNSVNRVHIQQKFEPIQPFLLVELAKTMGCQKFIDVGANVGIYSLFFSTLPTISQVYAFEPTPETYSDLVKNVRVNHLENKIFPRCLALSEKFGKALFV